jgi:membrane associated rhomboid family serine protease
LALLQSVYAIIIPQSIRELIMSEIAEYIPRTTARKERSPTVETALVLCVVFLIQYPLTLAGLGGLFALSPLVVVEPWTLVTSIYAHAGPAHLLSNLVVLIFVGLVVERVTTRRRFHTFFVVSGVIAGVAELVIGSVLSFELRAVIGASGAIFALLGYVITANPVSGGILSEIRARTDSELTVPIVLFSSAVVLSIVLSGPQSAVVAHFTGLLTGMVSGRWRLLKVIRRQ